LVVFDEVQWLPAENNQNLMYNIQCHCKIGLTATPYREDRKIECLNYLIGPILYEGNWRDFVDAGYLANPYCVEIRAKMTPLFAQKYQEQRVQKQ
jgi:DNA excision repair protein ERCC-3